MTGKLAYDDFPFRLYSDRHSNLAYVARHFGSLERYVRATYPRDSFHGHLADLLRLPPGITRSIIQNHVMSNDAKMRALWSVFVPYESRVAILTGAKGGGKTHEAWALGVDIYHMTHRRLCGLGDPDDIPDFAQPVGSLDDAPEWSIVVAPELGIQHSAQDWQSRDQKSLQGTIATARHRKQILIGDVQNSGMNNIAWLRLLDVLLLKPEGLFQTATERKPVRQKLRYFRELKPRHIGETLCLSKTMFPLRYHRPLSAWYSEAMSHSFAPFKSWEDALSRAIRIREKGNSFETIAQQLKPRGCAYSGEWWRRHLAEFNGGVDPLDEVRQHQPAARRAPRPRAEEMEMAA